MKAKMSDGIEVEGSPAELAEFFDAFVKAEKNAELFEKRSAAAKLAASHRVDRQPRHRKNTHFKELLGMTGEQFLARDPQAMSKTVEELVQSFYDSGLPTTVSRAKIKRYVKGWRLRHMHI